MRNSAARQISPIEETGQVIDLTTHFQKPEEFPTIIQHQCMVTMGVRMPTEEQKRQQQLCI